MLINSCPEPPLVCVSSAGEPGSPSRMLCMQHGKIDIWDLGIASRLQVLGLERVWHMVNPGMPCIALAAMHIWQPAHQLPAL